MTIRQHWELPGITITVTSHNIDYVNLEAGAMVRKHLLWLVGLIAWGGVMLPDAGSSPWHFNISEVFASSLVSIWLTVSIALRQLRM